MNPIIMHINYGELMGGSIGKRSIGDICAMAAQTGFDGIEFRGDPPKELAGLSFREYAGATAAGRKEYGLKEILFGISIKNSADPDSRVRKKAAEEAAEKAKIAADLCGTTLCNTFGADHWSRIPTAPAGAYEYCGSAAGTAEDWDYTVDTFRQLGQLLEPIGVKFAFETHMIFLHDTPAMAKRLVELIDSPAIGINMDYGNTVYFPGYPGVEETVDLYGDKLFYTHLKNSIALPGGGRMPTALGEGEINHRVYLEKLKAAGFRGPVGIEAPRPGDRTGFARQDLAYFKKVWAAV